MADQTHFTSKLSGQLVLIFGGTSGIGFAVAEACIEAGMTVIVSSSRQASIDRTLTRLQTAYPSLLKDPSRISGHVCDLASPADIDSSLERVFSSLPDPLDHVVVTAGDALSIVPLAERTVDSIQQTGMTRFIAPILIAKHAAPRLRAGLFSSLTFTGGTVAERPIPGWAVIAAYAAGLRGLVRGLAFDMKPIRVNGVEPGAVETEMWAAMPEQAREGMKEHAKARSTTGEMGQPRDVAEVYLYLMRDRNASGVVNRTDGGSVLV